MGVEKPLPPDESAKDPFDFKRVSAIITGLTPNRQEQFAVLIEKRYLLWKELFIPNSYIKVLHEIHKNAYAHFLKQPTVQDFYEKWGKHAHEFINMQTGEPVPNLRHLDDSTVRCLNKHGITAEKTIEVMNLAAQSIQHAWKQILRVPDKTPPMSVRLFQTRKHPQCLECSVMRTKDSAPYYEVGDRSHLIGDLRGIIHVGFHEPEHDIQARMQFRFKTDKSGALVGYKTDEQGGPIMNTYDDLRAIVRAPYVDPLWDMKSYLSVKEPWPCDVYFNTKNMNLEPLASAAYRRRPSEMGAHLQGYAAEMTMSAQLNLPVREHTREKLEESTRQFEALPESTKRWYKKTYPKPLVP